METKHNCAIFAEASEIIEGKLLDEDQSSYVMVNDPKATEGILLNGSYDFIYYDIFMISYHYKRHFCYQCSSDVIAFLFLQ